MKPAKLVENSGILASSVIPMDRLSGLSKLRSGDFTDGRKSSVNSRTSRGQILKTSCREKAVTSTDNRKTNSRTSKLTQTSTQSIQLPKENTPTLLKSSGSVSPRLQQKKLELEKQSQLNKPQPESGSPGGKCRPKAANLQQCDVQSSEISCEARNLSYKEDNISTRLDGHIVSYSGLDTEVTNSEYCAETNGSQSSSMKATKYSVSGLVQKKLAPRLSEDGALAEFASVAPEHPSPVSVLVDTIYQDDALSPIKHVPDALKDDGTLNYNDNCDRDQWEDSAENNMSNSMGSCLKSEINRKKLENIEHLVQKLRRLNSSHDEAHTDYIASFCENTNPDHRYISEILLASGLLLRDLNSSLTTFQLHPSGHPINPELFLVLEQKEESSIEKVGHKKPDKEKLHRKLIFDAVNEMLVGKLASVGASHEAWLSSDKLAKKYMNAQKLLRELCSEIEQLQENKSDCGLEDDDDGLKSILWEDMRHQSDRWTDFRAQIPGMVLYVERLIFKDLVGEIVHGVAAGLQTKLDSHCRQLFA